MKPADALRLPRARLTDEQRGHIARGIEEILEPGFPKEMSRSGISFDLTGDPVVIDELRRHCANEGWIAEVQPQLEPSRTYPGKMHLRGFKLILTPPKSAYDEVDAERLM